MTISKPKILVVGAGGIGMIGAYTLHYNKCCEVSVIVRSDYELARNRGINIDSVAYGKVDNWKPANLAANTNEAMKAFGPFDYIYLATKNIPDGSNKCEDVIRPAVTPGLTTILMVQNGIDIENAMFEAFPENIVLSGVTLSGAQNLHLEVKHVGPEVCTIGFFKHPTIDEKILEAKAKEFIEIYSNDLNTITYEPDVRSSRWRKLVYNASINPITALAGLDYSRVELCDGRATVLRPAMDEVVKVALADGYVIPDSHVQAMLEVSSGLFYTPSMLMDVRNNNLTELEIILGNCVKIARRHNVATPVLDTLYALMKMKQFDIKEKNGIIKVDTTINKDYSTYGKGF
ncbi:BA75_02038T0 [Komagataella pastoris]|uniref:2-dehydropantoate 2-reductase n=1 Tax=Komagataella pastoris TaxID=4922 RepID=A0A1B2JB03_PICPA|nr:BA75_02038T0 [Komagataella pastoris]